MAKIKYKTLIQWSNIKDMKYYTLTQEAKTQVLKDHKIYDLITLNISKNMSDTEFTYLIIDLTTK